MKNLKSKNLLIITNDFPHENYPMAGTFVKGQVDSITKYFNSVFVICPTPYMPAFISKFRFIPRAFRRAVNPVGYSYENISVYFPKFFMLPVDFSRKKAGERASKVTLKVVSKENINFDIIHAHFAYYAGCVGAKLEEKYKKPLIITGHGHDVYDWAFRDDFKEIIKSALDNSDYIITVSKSNYNKLMELGIEKEKVTIIPNGYDANQFKKISKEQCRNKLNISKNRMIILSVGYLEKIKGHEYLIKAMNTIVSKKHDVLCFIMGSGSSKAKLQKLINRLNLNDHIKLVDEKPHDEIPLWMNACDLFVLPSLRESFGVVQVEAMACGKPIVATRNGGSEEIIVNENLGYLVEAKNSDEMAEKILLALNRKWDKEYILDYVKKFRSDKIAKETLKIYEKVMN